MKKSTVMLGAAVLLAAVAATVLWLDLRGERAQGSELAARVAALEIAPAAAATSPMTAPGVPAPTEASVPAAATAPAAATSAPVPAPATSPERSGAPQSPVAAVLDTMQTPQGQEFAQAMMRGVMGQMYPDIAEKMGMSQQEADALFDLLVRQQQEITADSIGLLTGSVQDPAARRQIQRNLVEKQRSQEQELAAHLGARHAQWEDYQATAAARQQVNELRTALATGSDPLGDEQYDKLVAAFATETRRVTDEVRDWTYSAAAVDSPNMMQETMQRTVAAQRNLLEVARPHLNATQNARYRQQMEQQMGMLQAVMGMMGGQDAPGQAPAAPAAAPR